MLEELHLAEVTGQRFYQSDAIGALAGGMELERRALANMVAFCWTSGVWTSPLLVAARALSNGSRNLQR